MRGDVIVVEQYHVDAAARIVKELIDKIERFEPLLCLTIAGESGSGKSEIGKAVADQFKTKGIKSILLGQDDYLFTTKI